MFQPNPASIVDRIWDGRLAAVSVYSTNAALAGEEVTLPAHADIELSGGVFLGGLSCEVDLSHDGDDWEITGVEYCSDMFGMDAAKDSFDVAKLRAAPADGSLRDLIRREVLAQIDRQYNSLADAATIKARAQ